MKLDDNTRAALHYLLLGALVMMLLPGALGLLSGYDHYRPGIRSSMLFPFGHGYWVFKTHHWSLSLADSTAIERLMTAAVLAFLVALCAAVLGWTCAAFLNGRRARAAILSFRIVGGAGIALGIWSALMAPPCQVLAREDGVTITRHARILGDLTWPWPEDVEHLGSGEVRAVGRTDLDTGQQRISLWIGTSSGIDTIASMNIHDASERWADSSAIYLADYFHLR